MSSAKLAPPVQKSPSSHPATSASSRNTLDRAQNLARHLSASASSPSSTMSIKSTAQFTFRKIGAPNTLEHRVYLEKDGVPVSPFHDVPLYANDQGTVLNMIVEVPRWTNAKLEVRPPLSRIPR
jgi:inorganic pyrophosphatase